MNNLNRLCLALLRDYGYAVRGNVVISLGIRGFTSDRVWGRCRSPLDAAEMLCPVVRDAAYTDRLVKIQNAK